MVGHAFQFSRNGANRLGPGRDVNSGQRFQVAAIRHGMADGGVSGQRFHVVDAAEGGAAEHGPLDTAVLITKGYFQVMNRFAMA